MNQRSLSLKSIQIYREKYQLMRDNHTNVQIDVEFHTCLFIYIFPIFTNPYIYTGVRTKL